MSKYFLKVIHLKVRTKEGIFDISAFLSQELTDSAVVGDSLVKFESSNECLLIKKTGRQKYEYMFKPD